MIEYLPEEARVALESGDTWEYVPESAEYGVADVLYDDDADSWYQIWAVSGYLVEDGNLYEVFYTVDADGDWGDPDEAIVGTPEHTTMFASYYDRENIKHNWERYRTWVASTGRDPVGEFSYAINRTQSVDWEILVRESTIGVVVTAGLRDGSDEILMVDNLPDEVRQYLEMDERGVIGGALLDDPAWSAFRHLSHIVAQDDVRQLGRCAIGITVQEQRPEEDIHAEIIRRASGTEEVTG